MFGLNGDKSIAQVVSNEDLSTVDGSYTKPDITYDEQKGFEERKYSGMWANYAQVLDTDAG